MVESEQATRRSGVNGGTIARQRRTTLSPSRLGADQYAARVHPSALRRPSAALLAILALTLGGATACGGTEGTQTDCSLNSCTVTFPRGGTGEVSLLGVKTEFVGVEGDSVRLQVAGQTVTVPVGGEAATDGFMVGVERITDTEVVVKISR